MAGWKHNSAPVPGGAGSDVDFMYTVLWKNPDVEKWLNDITLQQSLVSNKVVITEWVLASAGGNRKKGQKMTKKDHVKALAENPILDKEKKFVEFYEKGFLYALFPVLPGRCEVGKIITAYLKSKRIDHVRAMMIPDGVGGSKYLLGVA